MAKYPAIHNSSYQKLCLKVEDVKPSQEIQGNKLKMSDCRQACICDSNWTYGKFFRYFGIFRLRELVLFHDIFVLLFQSIWRFK